MWEDVVVVGVMVFVGYWILHPLFRPRQSESFSSGMRENQRKVLQQSKEEVYQAIKEMDFDYGMGKISEDDYQELKSQYKAKALEILKELDTVDGGYDMDAAIEREVKQLRGEKAPKEERGNGKETVWQINFCPQCGSKATQNNNFCQACGARLIFSGGRE